MAHLAIFLMAAAVVAMILTAKRANGSALGWVLLLLSGGAQLALLFAGWGDFKNVHGGAILAVLIMFIGLFTFLGTLIAALPRPSRWRFLQLIGVASFSALLVVVGNVYGG